MSGPASVTTLGLPTSSSPCGGPELKVLPVLDLGVLAGVQPERSEQRPEVQSRHPG